MNNQELEQETGERMVRYFNNEASAEDVKDLYEWLQSSPKNRDLLFQLKDIYDLIQRNKSDAAENVDASWAKLLSRIKASHTHEAPCRKINKRAPMRWLSYAAVAAAAAMLGFWSNYHPETTTFNEVSVGRGGTSNRIVLADGSCVHLNAGSELRYPTVFAEESREVMLNGEAWFEITGNETKPFVVRLQQQTVTVRGTSFNVEAYADESVNVVTLASGRISLESCDREGKRISLIDMNPGDRAHFDRARETVAIEKVDSATANVWMNGEYKFRDEPMELILKRLANHYGVMILPDDSLKHIRYTGTFSFAQTVEQSLQLINYDNQFRLRKEGDTIYLMRKE
ncbi:MAG: FecR domain-containing protein [Tannerellaceae bacterium]|jgi:ferric-dicitrate binding protein FerR (iron transport regulator)|nr:FecR domain-containing protein [Tannerellaceae bacterium]